MKEKTADELFKELGYEENEENDYYIEYQKQEECCCKFIKLDLIDKSFTNFYYVVPEKQSYLSMEELQAINKKVEELRMARVKKIIQTIKLHKFKTEVNKKIIEEMDESSYLVWYKDGTCKEVNFKDDLIDILSKDHIKPIRYIFNMSDRIIVDRKIYINTEEVF